MTAALRYVLPSRPRSTDPAAAVVGAVIRHARLRKGLYQSDLADAIGVSALAISTMECARFAVPPARIDELAAVLGLDPETLRAPAHIAASDDERAVLAGFRRLLPDEAAALLELLREPSRGRSVPGAA